MTTGSAAAALVKSLAGAVTTLSELIGSPDTLDVLFRNFGQFLPPEADFESLTASFGQLPNHLLALASAAEQLDPASESALTLAGQVAAVVAALAPVVADIEQLAQNPPTAGLPAPLDDPAFWRTLGENLLGYLIYNSLADYAPGILATLRAVGIATAPVFDEQGASVVMPAQINWQSVPRLLSDPAGLIRDTYQWAAQFDHAALVGAAVQLVRSIQLEAPMQLPDESMLQLFWDPPPDTDDQGDATDPDPDAGIAPVAFGMPIWTGSGADLLQSSLLAGLIPIPDASRAGPPVGFALFLTADAALATTIPVTSSFSLNLGGDLQAGVFAAVRPTGTQLLTGGAEATADLSVGLTGKPPAPWTIGDPGGIRLQTSQLTLTLTLHAAVGTEPGVSSAALALEIDGSFAAYFDLSSADSFITSMIGTGAHSVSFTAGLSWSTKNGLRLKGGVTGGTDTGSPGVPLSTSIPVNLDLAGIVKVSAITIEAAPADGGAELRALVTGGLSLGPVTVTVDGLGAALRLDDAGPAANNLGKLRIGVALSGPKGMGLAIAAPLVTGGGYLAVDTANGRYVGAIELKVGTVTVQGVGVLSTRLPGGGWSLIALAEVSGLAVQLGFGIELTGIGVLVGVHRTMNVTGLQTLARSGQLQNILFPADLAANAPRVAADLDILFPPMPGQYVVGPIVQLSWGPAGLLTAELAIYIELPAPLRVAVLGVMQLTAPNPAAPIVNIHLDLLGVIDLTAKTLSLDMSLSHSTLATMPLTGQAALRAGWGAVPVFILAIGGFNPNFPAPAGFPALDRIGLSLGSVALVIRLTAYLAVTTNTLQLGARVDLRASAGPASLTASASFDALIQFDPFHLDINVAIHAAIVLWGSPLMALDITAHLSGPGPWQLQGQVHFSVLFLSFTVSVSGTFGTAIAAGSPPVADVIGPVVAAVGDLANWTMSIPSGVTGLVLRAGVAGAAVHPLGGLALHQPVAPLELPLERFGNGVLLAATTLHVSAGGQTSGTDGVSDLFAPAQFTTMTDAQRLAAPSFQSLTSGVAVAGDGTVLPTSTATSVSQPSAPPVNSVSTPGWSAIVLDPLPAAASTTDTGALERPAGSAAAAGAAAPASGPVPLAGPVSTPQAVLAGIGPPVGSAPSAYSGPSYGIGLDTPRYSIVATADQAPIMADSPDGMFGAQAAAATQLGSGQLVVYPSELMGSANAPEGSSV